MLHRLSRRSLCQWLTALIAIPFSVSRSLADPEPAAPPLDAATLQSLRKDAESSIQTANAQLANDPRDSAALSRRGDARFFLAQFKEAVADYDQMVALDPALRDSHWRRGIAMFYAGQFDEAAQQFERYHNYDNIDRENGIWRFLCQTKSTGLQQARQNLLKYEKDDREPFPDVFKLFAGTLAAEQILQRIDAAKVSEPDRQSRQFYAHLYIGLNHAVQDRPREAQTALSQATKNPWPRTAGYGPNWMWHVGRVQWDLLEKQRLTRTPGEK